jgi:hypothetical protein
VGTETQEAIIFSTDEEFAIGNPQIKHFLTGLTEEERPNNLRQKASPGALLQQQPMVESRRNFAVRAIASQ